MSGFEKAAFWHAFHSELEKLGFYMPPPTPAQTPTPPGGQPLPPKLTQPTMTNPPAAGAGNNPVSAVPVTGG